MNREDVARAVGFETPPEDGPQDAVWETLDRAPDKYDRTGALVTTGNPRKTRLNARRVLGQDTRWNGGTKPRIRHNDFAGVIEVDGKEMGKTSAVRIALWMEEQYQLEVRTEGVHEVISVLAEDEAYHPVREYLAGLKWDGRRRMSGLLSKYIGATDTELHEKISRRWMISAVARIMEPGCKVDTMLVLVGGQGARKSTTFATLAGDDWFSDSHIDFGSKDAYQQIPGTWIYEVAEMAGLSRREEETVKAFLSGACDKYRPSYGRHSITVPRQTVFVATTNVQEFLRDPTGARRFWPVRVGDIDLISLRRDRDQLWAEAVAAYQDGERWWFEAVESDELVAAQEEYREVDPWEAPIRDFLAAPLSSSGVEISEVLASALDVPKDKQTRSAAIRAAKLVQAHGWRKGRKRVGGNRVRVWLPPQ